MLLKEKCGDCDQRGGCWFRKEEGEKVLDDWEEVSLPIAFCAHAMCDDGRNVASDAIAGSDRYSFQIETILGLDYLVFRFFMKQQPFWVERIDRKVYQLDDSGMLRAIGVRV